MHRREELSHVLNPSHFRAALLREKELVPRVAAVGKKQERGDDDRNYGQSKDQPIKEAQPPATFVTDGEIS